MTSSKTDTSNLKTAAQNDKIDKQARIRDLNHAPNASKTTADKYV